MLHSVKHTENAQENLDSLPCKYTLEAYVFAETYSTYIQRMSQHFRNFACEVIDTLVSYLALTQ